MDILNKEKPMPPPCSRKIILCDHSAVIDPSRSLFNFTTEFLDHPDELEMDILGFSGGAPCFTLKWRFESGMVVGGVYSFTGSHNDPVLI